MKSQGFLAKIDVKIQERVNASQKLGADKALDLAKRVDKIMVAKGKTVTSFDMKVEPVDDSVLLSYLLGPTGNLRAPTIRKEKTLLVGFNEDVYGEVLVSG